MRLFDSVSRRLKVLNGGNKTLTWYTCGPTVYDDMHLGHGRAYIYVDLIQRVLSRLANSSVSHALGMTDIDGKIVARASEQGQCPRELARYYEQRFHEDMSSLNVVPPECVLRVSESIDEIVHYVGSIVESRFAYVGRRTGSVYFDVAKYDQVHGYKKLVPRCHHHRIDDADDVDHEASEKNDVRDFALWKRFDGDVNETSRWSSPWGAGRPGWHIECSAMSALQFGDALDVHAGGIDLAFPHHANEIAQCGARAGHDEWPRQCFVHVGHLHIAGRKMSKSLKNFTSVRQMLDDGHSAASFRLFCAMTKYGEPTDYSDERLANARDLLLKMREFDARARSLRANRQPSKRWGDAEYALRQSLRDAQRSVHDALLDNVDTPTALRHIVALIGAANRYLDSSERRDALLCRAVATFVRHIVDDVLGIDVAPSRAPSSSDAWIDRLVEFRADVRRAALESKPKAGAVLSLCDELRDNTLPSLGVVASDTADQIRWRHRTADDDK
jgi:cysteinyl-tRNA synthetase